MSVHLRREIDRLKRELLSLCALVDEQVQLAVRALLERDGALAREVCKRDAEVDHREVELEEQCLKVLALHQPVAIDLRFIVSALKINNDLATNIAEDVIYMIDGKIIRHQEGNNGEAPSGMNTSRQPDQATSAADPHR